MSVKYPSHLYIRIDRSLRADLLAAAEADGESVSAFARGLLRAGLSDAQRDPAHASHKAAPAIPEAESAR